MSKKPLPTSIPRTQKLVKTKWGNITYHAWGLGDQSILLQRLVADEDSTVTTEERYDALREIIEKNVVSYTDQTGKALDPLEMPVFLSEFLLLKLRAISIGETVDFVRPCGEGECKCERVILSTNLDEATIIENENFQDEFKMGEYTFKLRFPSYRGTLELAELESLENISEEVLSRFIDCVYTEDDAWYMNEYTQEEKNQFMKLLGSDFQLFVLEKYVKNMPKCSMTLKGTCPDCGHEHVLKLDSGVSKLFQ